MEVVGDGRRLRVRRGKGGEVLLPSSLCLWGLLLGALSLLLWGAECGAYSYSYGYGGGDGGGRPIDLNQVKALTLRKGEYTAGRRLPGVPQLQCVGGCDYEPEDDRVLEGSCGLSYTLKRLPGGGGKYNSRERYERTQKKSWGFGKLIGFAVFAYFGLRIWQLCAKARQHRSDDYQPSAPPYPGNGFSAPGSAFPSPPYYAAPQPPPHGYPDSQGYGASVPRPPGSGIASSGISWPSAFSGFGLGYLFGRSGHGNPTAGGGYSQPSRRRPWNSSDNGSHNIAETWPEEEKSHQRHQDSFHTSTAYASTSKR
ncbi:hypothetical protein CBR_g36285 [Chara braunii]|uniref:Store-operated calcium entry-associated regulatory factor n=1 Tax=Chara braunii TaxID=69332 RepID=A0A388LKJ1_CHABU|nr:hypothetical protein CBR_g36285 [Chara braunii]|eukprot:GBG82755.1 hypothetical protein CBR_g36285 [Chara braunii]